MKKLIVLLLLIPCISSAQWDPIHIHTLTGSVAALPSSDNLIVAPKGGYMHLSYDAGETFVHESLPYVNEWFSDLDFPTDSIGYVVGGTAFGDYTNIVIKTIDAGQTWELMTANEFAGYSFNSVAFLNSELGILAGELGTMIKTQDGCNSFSAVSPPFENAQITDLEFAGSRIIGAFREVVSPDEEEYSIHISDDFGETWESVYSDFVQGADNMNYRAISDIQFLDELQGFCVGGSGLFMRTFDGGQTWESSLITPYFNLTSVFFSSPLIGYINNIGGIFKTIDGGVTWTPQNINLPSIITDIIMLNDEVGYAIGDDIIYKTINGGDISTSLEYIEPFNNIRIHPNPASDVLRVEGNISKQDYEIRDIEGRLVMQVDGNTKEIDLESLANGAYTIRFLSAIKERSIKFIVRK